MVCVGEMENVFIILIEVIQRRKVLEYHFRGLKLVCTPGLLLVGQKTFVQSAVKF